jgi:hypothetical protein
MGAQIKPSKNNNIFQSRSDLWGRLIMSGHGLRARIAAVGLLVAGAALAPSGAGAVETVVFRDDGRAQWQELFAPTGPTCAAVTRSGTSLRIQACPPSGTGNVLWARPKVVPGPAAIRVEFDYKLISAVDPTPDNPNDTGTMSAIMFMASGDGTTGFPVDVTTWGAAQCCGGVGVYGPHMLGLQLNFAYRFDPRGDAVMTLRALKGSVGSYQQLSDAPPVFAVQTNRSYHVSMVRGGSTVTVTLKDNATRAKKSFSVTNAYIARPVNGWIGFRQMIGRTSLVTNFKVTKVN